MMSSKKKEKKSSRQSKAADEHLDDDIFVWADNSFSSVASSVTAPPSQTASFYKKVLGQKDKYDYGSSYDGSVDGDTSSLGDSNHSFDTGDASSDGPGREKKDKKKKKKSLKGRRRFFGGGATIPEAHDEDASAAPSVKSRPRRRLSLFGGASSTSGGSVDSVPISTHSPTRDTEDDSSISLNDVHDDDQQQPEPPRQQQRPRANSADNVDLGYEDAAPSVKSGKRGVARRSSLGMKIKEAITGGGGGAEDAEPKGRSRRRSSLGFFQPKQEEPAPEPTAGGGGSRRRSSMFGSMTKNETAVQPDKPNRRRRNSIGAPSEPAFPSPPGSTGELDEDNSVTPSIKSSKSKGGRLKKLFHTNSFESQKVEIHWIVNHERVARGMEPFTRNYVLDKMAKSMSGELAEGLNPTPSSYYGNVGQGTSLEKIHSTIMDDRSGISRKNILSTKFTEFGMALTQASNGTFFMVQLFS